MRKKITPVFFLAVLIATASFAAHAYTEVTDGVDSAFVVEEVATTAHGDFESRFGGMYDLPEVSEMPEAEMGEMPEVKPGVPDWVRDEVPGQELTAIYCAATKWRTGEFVASLKAVKDNVVPLVALAKDAGVQVQAPDLDSYLAEADERILRICGADNLDLAESLGNDFQAWASVDVRGDLEYFRQKMISDIQAAGDELRESLRVAVDETVKREREKAEAEVRAYAEQLAADATANFEKEEDPTQAEVDQVKARVEEQVRSMAETKRQGIEETVQRKAQEILRDRPVKFQLLGSAASGIAERIAAAAESRAAEYEKYRDEARRLRKALVLKTVEDRIVAGMGELTAHAGDIELAKQYDATLKGVPEFKTELLESRQRLLTAIGNAIDSDDDAALRFALKTFQDKWEAYRLQVDNAASKAMGRACETAVARLDEAKPKLSESYDKAKQLLAKCEGNDLTACQEIAVFAPRLNSLATKLDDLLFEIGEVDRVCADPEGVDRQALVALLEKVKVDGLSAQAFGESLEAARDVHLSSLIRAHCNAMLPEIRTLLIEMKTEDLAAMSKLVSRCSPGPDVVAPDYCGGVSALMDDYQGAESAVSSFESDYESMKTRCTLDGSEDNYPVIAASLRALRDDGEKLSEVVANLRGSFGSHVSWSAFCRSARQVALGVKRTLALDEKAIGDAVFGCEAQPLPPCDRIDDHRPEIAEVSADISALNERATMVIDECADKYYEIGSLPEQSQVTELASLRADALRVSEDSRNLVTRIEMGISDDSSGRIWLEAEDATEYGRSVGGAPNVREISPDWRPPYFGSGTWLLSSSGQYMEIDFQVPMDGTYAVWVRDLSAMGTGNRSASLMVDGRPFGVFSESSAGAAVAEPGLFAWHEVALVDLKSGSHSLRVTKGDGGPVVLDAFYLTTGNDSPVDKSR